MRYYMNIIPTELTISPKNVLNVLEGAGNIQNIVPPLEDFHILYFTNKDDFIFFISGGNIILVGELPHSISVGPIYGLAFNPELNKYQIVGHLTP